MEQFNSTFAQLLENTSAQPDTSDILMSLGIALLMSVILWLTYKFTNAHGGYQPKFAVTLVSLALLSTIIMDLIQFNLALSLGMLGSFSIVRFRTNIRDPRDIGFIFWSMTIGLAASTGLYVIGLAGCLLMSGVMLITRRKASLPEEMMLIIRGGNTDPEILHTIVEDCCISNSVKAKNLLADSCELVYEVRIPLQESDRMMQGLLEVSGVDSVNLLAERKTI